MSIIRPVTRFFYGRFMAGVQVTADGKTTDCFWKDYYVPFDVALKAAEESAKEVYQATLLDGCAATYAEHNEVHHSFSVN